MLEAVCFYAFAALLLAAAVAVVLHPQPIYSVLSLLVVMFCLASLFVMLHAYFVAALQMLLYAGAVLVLFLFVIMLLNLEPEALARTRRLTLRTVGPVAALWLFILLARIATHAGMDLPLAAAPASLGTVEATGRALLTTYAIPFELTSFLILAAIIGAVTLGKQESSRSTPSRRHAITAQMIPLTHYLIVSALLFAIGIAGIMMRRNVLMILLCIELMFNAANLAFVAYARAWGDVGGQVIVFFVITVAAAEITVGLAIAILLSRRLKTLNADEIRLLKW